MQSWRKPKLSIVLWIAAAAWCGVLFFFSGQDATESGELSLRFTRWVLRVLPFLPYSVETLEPILRDCAHFGIFAVEGTLLGAAMMTCLNSHAAGALLSALCCAAIAVLNEYHQSFAEGRACEVYDMLLDSGGGVTGVLFAALVLWLAFGAAARAERRRENVII